VATTILYVCPIDPDQVLYVEHVNTASTQYRMRGMRRQVSFALGRIASKNVRISSRERALRKRQVSQILYRDRRKRMKSIVQPLPRINNISAIREPRELSKLIRRGSKSHRFITCQFCYGSGIFRSGVNMSERPLRCPECRGSGIVMPERPRTCPDCHKPWYKWQCTRIEQEG
jgi:hypothetical protein